MSLHHERGEFPRALSQIPYRREIMAVSDDVGAQIAAMKQNSVDSIAMQRIASDIQADNAKTTAFCTTQTSLAQTITQSTQKAWNGITDMTRPR
jgi:siroheme synthase (precorrin-2 oxidase/ferrochelatase)